MPKDYLESPLVKPTTADLNLSSTHAAIRARLFGRFASQADGVVIQYGGSVKPETAAALLAEADVDGALVGGASLDASAFGSIIAAGAV